jgi:hypothetical protein
VFAVMAWFRCLTSSLVFGRPALTVLGSFLATRDCGWRVRKRDRLWVADWRGPGRPGFAREVDAQTGRSRRMIPAGRSPVGIGGHSIR